MAKGVFVVIPIGPEEDAQVDRMASFLVEYLARSELVLQAHVLDDEELVALVALSLAQ